MEVFYNNFQVGEMILNRADYFRDHWPLRQSSVLKKAKSFIGFFSSNGFFTEAIYYPLPFQPKTDNERKIYLGYRKRKILLGSAAPLDPGGLLFGFQADYIDDKMLVARGSPDFDSLYYRSYLYPQKLMNELYLKRQNLIREKLSLWINDYKAADLKLIKIKKNRKSEVLKLQIVPSKNIDETLIFIGPGHRLRSHELPEKLNFSLKYTTTENQVINSPLPGWFCEKRKIPVTLKLPKLNFIKGS